MNKIYILLLSFSFTLIACKSASKAYDEGNYTNAIELAIKKLQKILMMVEQKRLQKALIPTPLTITRTIYVPCQTAQTMTVLKNYIMSISGCKNFIH